MPFYRRYKMSVSPGKIKLDYRIIMSLVKPNSSVLDLGCGDGELLSLLINNNQVTRAQGIEINEQAIYKCVARGLSVFHGDLDSGLSDYADKSFDYVILDESLQEVRHPDTALKEALRVGKEAIVVFPNFAYHKARWQLCFRGRVPITVSLPYSWYDTPNIHFLSILDFIDYCHQRNIAIEKSIFLTQDKIIKLFPNLRAAIGIFVIKK